mgnify:CR=1 FL=1
MKFKVSLFIVALGFTFGCNSGETQNDHGHEHGSETHMHEEEHGHAHENGDQHHEQEEFTVPADSTKLKSDSTHVHEDGSEHPDH